MIDTAESQGSESVIGEATRGIRERVFLATKVSPEHYGYREVLRAADESLCRLGASHIDLSIKALRTTGVSPQVKALLARESEGAKTLRQDIIIFRCKCHGRKPVGIY